MIRLEKKKVVVAGLGRTGFQASKYLASAGADVFVAEDKNNSSIAVKAEELKTMGVCVQVGGDAEGFLEGADLVVASPGVPCHAPVLKRALEKGIRVISEVELAFEVSPGRRIIAVTGTNGKTTTVSMIEAFLRSAGKPVIACGNIGNPFIGEIGRITPETFVVLEVSSFQLERTVNFRPMAALLLNIDYDHMDRHLSLEEYIEAKSRIFINQGKSDWGIINYDDPICRGLSDRINARKVFFSMKEAPETGAFYGDGEVAVRLGARNLKLKIGSGRLYGPGNIYNVMAAALAAMICGAGKDAIRDSLRVFESPPHRMERVAEIGGVVFINDSKATNAHAVSNALASLPSGRKIILIMGGRDKNISFEPLVPLVKSKVKMLVLMGEAGQRIRSQLVSPDMPCRMARDLDEAVLLSFAGAEKGDFVLLSPGCSSFDAYKDYQERGNEFKRAVSSLY